MSWICPKCETENPDRLKVCEVCDTPRESSPMDKLKSKLKEKYSDGAYKSFIRYHYSLLASADQGNSIDQYKVGEWFFNKHSEDCYTIAATWFLEAAKQGHMSAQTMLASCYEEGYGVPKAIETAIKWYKEAANKGDSTAKQRYLKLKYDSKTYEAVVEYRMELLWTADNGNRTSQYEVGKWFEDHNSNNQFAYRKEASIWYERAANHGQRDAMFEIGKCYEYGLGVSRNHSKALEWYEKAAKRGIKSARLKLANAYLYGNTVTKNVAEAVKWYELAGGDISGADLCNIGYAYDVGDSVAMDKAEALYYYRRAADKGEKVAQYNLGVCYENGDGVSCNIHEAKYWYEKAASQGYAQAQQCITRIDAKIRTERQEGIIIKLLVYLFFGSVFGAIGYYILTEGLLKWGIHIPEVWPNTFPTNLIICLAIGIIIAILIEKS